MIIMFVNNRWDQACIAAMVSFMNVGANLWTERSMKALRFCILCLDKYEGKVTHDVYVISGQGSMAVSQYFSAIVKNFCGYPFVSGVALFWRTPRSKLARVLHP